MKNWLIEMLFLLLSVLILPLRHHEVDSTESRGFASHNLGEDEDQLRNLVKTSLASFGGCSVSGEISRQDQPQEKQEFFLSIDNRNENANFALVRENRSEKGILSNQKIEVAKRSDFAIKRNSQVSFEHDKRHSIKSLSAVIDSFSNQFDYILLEAQWLLGSSPFDSSSIAEILDSSKISIEKHYQDGLVVIAKHAKKGKYRFNLSRSTGTLRLISLTVEKSRDNSVSIRGVEKPLVEIGGEEGIESYEENVRYSYSGSTISEIKIHQKTMQIDGGMFESEVVVKIHGITNCDEKLFQTVHFDGIDNSVPIPVIVIGKENIKYHLHDSKIKRSIDPAALTPTDLKVLRLEGGSSLHSYEARILPH